MSVCACLGALSDCAGIDSGAGAGWDIDRVARVGAASPLKAKLLSAVRRIGIWISGGTTGAVAIPSKKSWSSIRLCSFVLVRSVTAVVDLESDADEDFVSTGRMAPTLVDGKS